MLRKFAAVGAVAVTPLLPGVAFAAQNKASHVTKGAQGSRSAPGNRTMHIYKSVLVNKGMRVNRTLRTNRSVHINKGIHTNRSVMGNQRLVVGRRYHGGVWYGHKRRFWHGQWWAYGTGKCWLSTPIGYVWICD